MKKILFFTFIFFMLFSGVAFGMTFNEFIQQYPNDFIYRVDYSDGTNNYISSPVELEFGLSDYLSGEPLVSGKSLVIKNPTLATYYRLTSDGTISSRDREFTYIVEDLKARIGIEGDIHIYKWNGSSFFLPTPSTFLRVLVGQIPMILPVGFGIVSAVLLIRLLAVYFRRYLLRLI